jgi:hypothetical protein
MPDDKLILRVEAHRHYSPDTPAKIIKLPIEGACVEINDADGKPAGSVCACVGSSIEIEDFTTGEKWSVSALDLWLAYVTKKGA